VKTILDNGPIRFSFIFHLREPTLQACNFTVEVESLTTKSLEGMAENEPESPSSSEPTESEPEALPLIPQPPPRPCFKGLSSNEANHIRRSWEKLIYQYVRAYGTLSNEPCGPCSRTQTPCIRHPLIKKCAICFRGHDVCEMWDASVQNIHRRRVGTRRVQKKETEVEYLVKRLILRALAKGRVVWVTCQLKTGLCNSERRLK